MSRRTHCKRATQHFRLFDSNDAYECLCILTLPSSLAPSPPYAGRYTVASRFWCQFFLVILQLWVHCPRASNGLLPRRSYLVGYAQWDARFDLFLLCQTIISSSFTGRSMVRILWEQSESSLAPSHSFYRCATFWRETATVDPLQQPTSRPHALALERPP